MKYTTKENESFDAEILRKELVAAIGPNGWSLQTGGNTVTFDYAWGELPEGYPALIESTILAHFANSAKRENNTSVSQNIQAIEQANPITHRTQREFMIGVQTMLASILGITPEQMLDKNDPNYSHAYAAFVSVNAETIAERARRIP